MEKLALSNFLVIDSKRKTWPLSIAELGHFDENAWVRSGRAPKAPLDQFDAERFLINSNSALWESSEDEVRSGITTADSLTGPRDRQFSLAGLTGIWTLFGGGDRMCPGRHYAKTEMIATFALLFNKFDLELLVADPSEVRPNMRFAPFGSRPPTCAVPFRLRRKSVTGN